MPDTTVICAISTMSGAPQIAADVGNTIAILDAVLVNGFGSVTLDSLVVSGGVATATKATGHGLAMLANTGPVIQIAGATPAGLNGRWRVASVPGSTTITFACPGVADGAATGTITMKRAPAGWEKVFAGTNKAAYRSADPAGTRLYLHVDDTNQNYATVTGYELMTDVDTGTGGFGSCYWRRKDSGVPEWFIFADSRMLYFLIPWGTSFGSWCDVYVFGDIASYRAAGDAYGCVVGGLSINNLSYQNTNFYSLNNADSGQSLYNLARSYTQSGGAVGWYRVSHGVTGTVMGGTNTGIAYPDAMNSGLVVAPVEVRESGGMVRGALPGLAAPQHFKTPAAKTAVAGGVRDYYVLSLGMTSDLGRIAMDLTGPWRTQ